MTTRAPPFPPPDIESPNLPQSRLGRAPSAGMARPRAAGPGRAVGLVLALLAGGALLLAGPAEGDYQRRDYLAAVMSLAADGGGFAGGSGTSPNVCAVGPGGAVKCWGSNRQGTLGYSDLQKRGMAAGDMGEHLPDVDFGTGRE